MAFFWPSALSLFQDGGNSLYSLSPPGLNLPFRSLPQYFSLPLPPFPSYPFTFSTLLPPHLLPCCGFTAASSKFHSVVFILGNFFIPPMFIHDRGSERERERDKKPSAELAPEGCEGSKSVTCNTQTHVHINTKRKSTWNARVHACECTSTHTHTRLTLLQHAAFSVSHHVQTEAFCP